MKFLVLGAGRMGFALVYDLIRSPKVEKVIVADQDVKRINFIVDHFSDPKIVPVELDASNHQEVVALMQQCDVTLSCVTYKHNYELTKLAIQARCHFVDLGGNDTIVGQQFQLHDLAKERGVTIIPDLGLAPGMVSVLAVNAAESMDELYEIKIRVGGLPVERENLILNYAQFFAMDGLINEYVEDVTVIRDGKLYRLPSLTDVEDIEFEEPFGVLEAFNTSGGVSTLPQTYLGKIRHLDYKTIRYPGHCMQVKLLKDLGFMSSDPVKLPSGAKLAPRELLHHQLSEKLHQDEPDVVLIRVVVTGIKNKKPHQVHWECIDYNDQAEGLTAMMRTTALPMSIIAQMIARGDIKGRGVLRQEHSVPVKMFLNELDNRGIKMTMTEGAPHVEGADDDDKVNVKASKEKPAKEKASEKAIKVKAGKGK